jgi:hypothetical protein
MTSLFGGGTAINVNASGTLVPQSFTPTDGQTLFNITLFSYTIGTNSLIVFINGLKQRVNTDFIETSTTSFTLISSVLSTDVVEIIGFPLASLQFLPDSSIITYNQGTTGATTVKTRLGFIEGISPSITNQDAAQKAGVNTFRDASGVTGGTPGYVNFSIYNRTITGATETAFEWGICSVLDNYAASGENVAVYSQGNKRAVGPTWAGVFEARDKTGTANPTKGLVGIEVDTFGNGTDGNSTRVGVDISIGRDNTSGSIMETSYGVRVGALNGSLAEGRVIRAFATGVIEFDCAFDSSLGTQSAAGVAFRMAVGQKLSFAATNDRTLLYSGGVLAYQVSGGTKYTISDVGATNQVGTFSINAVQVLTSRRTGYTNAMSGTADRATPYDTSTITLVQLAQRVKAIEDDLLTHGLIGT